MNHETLSALLDGECSPAELDLVLKRLDQDPALRARFSRMSFAQQLLRGVGVRPVPADFADRVMAALPARTSRATVLPRRAMAWQPLAGLAAAAAVGGVAVLAAQPRPAAAPPAPMAEVSAGEQPMVALDDANARQLRNYLMAYSQSRAYHGVGGTLGYARYAAYTTVDRGDDPADGSR